MEYAAVIKQLLWKTERRKSMKATLVFAGLVALFFAFLLGQWFRACGHQACFGLEEVANPPLRQTSVIYAGDGTMLAEVGTERRASIPLSRMGAVLKNAFIVTEDRRFYHHHGVDYLRVFGALAANVAHGQVSQGFSTITMQLARNLWPETIDGRDRTIIRKIREIQAAYSLERRYPKDRILELYLNQIPLGGQLYGVEPAARAYFGKSASDLNVAEAATLAALPKGPSFYNPRYYPQRAIGRRNLVIDLLRRHGDLTEREATWWKQYPLKLIPPTRSRAVAPYFAEYVRQLVDRRFSNELRRGGLKIFTTLDPEIQRNAERALEAQLEAIEAGRYGSYPRKSYASYRRSGDSATSGASPYLQGMVVVQEAATGRILAMVGGRDFDDSKFNRVTQARRQPGSAFKPFVFSAAIRRGDPLSQLVDDEPVSIPSTEVNEPDWTPQNSDYQFQGPITLREALYRSRNAATVRLGMDVGLPAVIQEAKLFGLTTRLLPYPSLLLGTSEVEPLEMVSAFSAFANVGDRTTANPILRVEDSEGKVLWEPGVERTRVMDPAHAWLMTNALRDVVRRGTAYSAVAGAGFTLPSAGKTGTSDDYADVWYIGFTSDLVTGIWMGMDRRQRILAGAQGGHLAAPVWTAIMKEVYRHRPAPADWLEPPGILNLLIDRTSGFLATGDCPGEDLMTESFLPGTEPTQYCPVHTSPLMQETSFNPGALDTLNPSRP
jgi:penicillin-binding protein 1A